jgi:hypothetical protein
MSRRYHAKMLVTAIAIIAASPTLTAQTTQPKSKPGSEKSQPEATQTPTSSPSKKPVGGDTATRGIQLEESSYCDVSPPCPRGCIADASNKVCLEPKE